MKRGSNQVTGTVDRRGFIKGVGLAAMLGLADGSTLATTTSPVWADDYPLSPNASMYRTLVPEIFAPLPDPDDHMPAIVIGSGFGASITALRLAQSGTEVAVLERGSRWPSDPWRDIFAVDTIPDGRGFWHRTSFTGVTRISASFDPFGGVLDISSYPGMDVWRGACVGGGSVVFTGVMIEPEQRFFDHVFRGVVDYGEMHELYYPKVRKTLRLSPIPDDIYYSSAFAHARAWDDQVRAADYIPERIDGIWKWDVIRDELVGRSRPSATVGCSNLGNSNGAKFDLNQNYLRYAEDTGRARIYPGHRVDAIAKEPGVSGRYIVTVTKLAPTGEVLRIRTLTCDKLFLGAGSIGTSELLVRARAMSVWLGRSARSAWARKARRPRAGFWTRRAHLCRWRTGTSPARRLSTSALSRRWAWCSTTLAAGSSTTRPSDRWTCSGHTTARPTTLRERGKSTTRRPATACPSPHRSWVGMPHSPHIRWAAQ
jgi:cholesterol oxidase